MDWFGGLAGWFGGLVWWLGWVVWWLGLVAGLGGIVDLGGRRVGRYGGLAWSSGRASALFDELVLPRLMLYLHSLCVSTS